MGKGYVTLAPGLNRTSVGLKRNRFGEKATVRMMPQSNQRGIETIELPHRPFSSRMPQSNQRGIETSELECGSRLPPQASIEPAWD